MCLDTVREFQVKINPKEKEYVAWKIFILKKHRLRSIYFAKRKNYIENIWYKSSNRKIHYNKFHDYYSSGFHCFSNKKDAQDEQHKLLHGIAVIRKVFIRKITTTGEQGHVKVIVAKEMYIHSQV